ncbi:unnamed protein product, partial [Wuchereria bancrofti]
MYIGEEQSRVPMEESEITTLSYGKQESEKQEMNGLEERGIAADLKICTHLGWADDSPLGENYLSHMKGIIRYLFLTATTKNYIQATSSKIRKTICFDEVNQNAHWVGSEVNEVGRAWTEMGVNVRVAYLEISKITFT